MYHYAFTSHITFHVSLIPHGQSPNTRSFDVVDVRRFAGSKVKQGNQPAGIGRIGLSD